MSDRRWSIVAIVGIVDIHRMKCKYHGVCNCRIAGSKRATDKVAILGSWIRSFVTVWSISCGDRNNVKGSSWWILNWPPRCCFPSLWSLLWWQLAVYNIKPPLITAAFVFSWSVDLQMMILGLSYPNSVLSCMTKEIAIFAQYTNSLLILLHYCFPSIRGRSNFSHLCQLYMWIEMANMLSNLFHRAFIVMCSDHFICMWYRMYMGNSIQWCMNLKEWPDDLEISSNGVKTKVVAFCLLIASVVLVLSNSTSILVITHVLCFRPCNAYYMM